MRATRSAILILICFLTGLSPHSQASSRSGSECKHFYSLGSIRSHVVEFIQQYTPYLTNELGITRKVFLAEGRKDVVIDSDPLACRFCFGGAEFLLQDLFRYFPNGDWRVVETVQKFQSFFHLYLYSPIYNLVVDPTYRQFLIESRSADFDSLPKIFVGSGPEFAHLLKDRLPPEAIGILFDAKDVTNQMSIPNRHQRFYLQQK